MRALLPHKRLIRYSHHGGPGSSMRPANVKCTLLYGGVSSDVQSTSESYLMIPNKYIQMLPSRLNNLAIAGDENAQKMLLIHEQLDQLIGKTIKLMDQIKPVKDPRPEPHP